MSNYTGGAQPVNILTFRAPTDTPTRTRCIQLDDPTAPAAPTAPIIPEVIDPADLANAEFAMQVREHIAATTPVCRVVDLLGMPDESRRSLLRFFHSCTQGLRIRVDDASDEHANPFAAVLAAMVGSGDPARCERGRQIAIEAVVLLYRNAITPACNLVVDRCRQLGLHGVRVGDVLAEARDLAAEMRERGDGEAVYVRDVLTDAPVPDEAVVPYGWVLSTEGIVGPGRTRIAAPVLIIARMVNTADNTELTLLAYLRDRQWRRLTVDRVTTASQRLIVDLASSGAPVTTNNARALVQFLDEFETVNFSLLPVAQVTSQLGWQGVGGRDGFLCGRSLIGTNGLRGGANLTELHPSEWPPDSICFQGADGGDNQLADGFRVEGTFGDWADAVRPLANFPRVRLAIYASLAAPILAIVDAPNFVVDYAGVTSQGKTTTLRVAASCWGNPDERLPSAAIGTWASTCVWRERASAVLNSLPLIVDDTKLARRRVDVANTIYEITSGRGRGRGSPQGMARSGTWTTVGIFSGEAPATSFTGDGGTRARTLTLWGSPFGSADENTGRIVNQINAGVRENFGHLGPMFVQFLLANRDRWPDWRRHYRRLRERYERRAAGNPIANRLAAYLAVLRLTAILVHRAVEMPWGYTRVVDRLWDVWVAEAEGGDRPAEALRLVVSWAVAHRIEFFGQAPADRRPGNGWAGRWDGTGAGRHGPWRAISLFPEKLNEILTAQGYESEAVLRAWGGTGWLETTTEGGRTRQRVKQRVDGASAWLVAIKREAITQLVGDLDQELVPDGHERPGAAARRPQRPGPCTEGREEAGLPAEGNGGQEAGRGCGPGEQPGHRCGYALSP